jgi:hypothetical protein
MQVAKSMRAEVLPLSVSSLKIRQIKSLRIDLLRVVPRSALPTSIKSMTTGVALKVLAALASGDGDRNAPGSSHRNANRNVEECVASFRMQHDLTHENTNPGIVWKETTVGALLRRLIAFYQRYSDASLLLAVIARLWRRTARLSFRFGLRADWRGRSSTRLIR